ncbi:MAG: DUF1722 domain-containing protein, partial [Asgard group archaeon]|nr:DUF1722 domain-containing protein [Asgard group archaeon]
INSKSKNYFILFRKNLLVSPSRENIVKSCKNLQKHLKGDISKNETLFLEDLYKQFISNYIPKEGVFSALQTLAIHYDNDYIKSQTLFQPFPPNLVDWDDYYMRRFRVNAYDSEIRHV